MKHRKAGCSAFGVFIFYFFLLLVRTHAFYICGRGSKEWGEDGLSQKYGGLFFFFFYKWLQGYIPVCRQMSRSELRHSAQTHSSVSPKGTYIHTLLCVVWVGWDGFKGLFLTDAKLLGDYRQRNGYFVKDGGWGSGGGGYLSMWGEKNLPAGSKTKYYVTAVQEVNVGRCPAPAWLGGLHNLVPGIVQNFDVQSCSENIVHLLHENRLESGVWGQND